MEKRLLYTIITLLGLSMFTLSSCKDDPNGETANASANGDNLVMTTRATLSGVINNMRAYSFYKGGANDAKFKTSLILAKDVNKVSSKVEVGDWYFTLVSADPTVDILTPSTMVTKENAPMYVYAPTIDASTKVSSSAPEIFTAFTEGAIVADQTTTVNNLDIARNVAKVEIFIEKATPNFKTTGSNHMLKLDKIPSTISHTGTLLPSKTSPTLLSTPLQAPVTFASSTTNTGYLESQVIEFIIPAHKGTDFTSTTPTDITTQKMTLTLDLERLGGGSNFQKTVEIPQVALCNKIIRINVEVNDGVQVTTKILDWNEVDLNVIAGEGYQNWIYVKKGATGTGQSWSDPMGSIISAVTAAKSLIAAGTTVHGILVAGGSSYVYDENVELNAAGVKIYGGWTGTVGTELSSSDSQAVYKSTARDLKNHKAILTLTGTNRVALTAANTVFDGFTVKSATVSSGDLVAVSNASAFVNAVEITGNNMSINSVFAMTAGTASSVLIADNTSGISISGGAKLINATVANNTGTSTINTATVLNCAFWRSAVTFTGTNTIEYCAIEGTQSSIPAGTTHTNVGLNNDNTAWFTTINVVPGPHFYQSTGSTYKYYEALNDRNPLIGRGNQASYDSNTSSYIPTGYEHDIDGNSRHVSNSTITTAVTDIGCYEAADGFTGFIMNWATDRIYVTYKATYLSQQPLMIPNNDIYEIGVAWTATTSASFNYTSLLDGPGGATTTSVSGSGTGVVAGSLSFRNAGNSTPTDDYTGSAERQCGTITISTNLGNYLPDTEIQVWQTSGNASLWYAGYVGSFHRNNEVGARYISVSNTTTWSARVVSGLDWIKIDAHDKTYGNDITDPDEGTPPGGGYYKDVEQVWSGVVSGTGNIKFRVGMQSKNNTGAPRYGLIVITRGTAVSMFFVRQGEDPDYLYRDVDDKPTYGTRTGIVKFSAFNVTDSQGRASTTGTDLGTNGGGFTQYPTQVGYYFRWNDTVAYLYGTVTSASSSANYTSWATSREVCPSGYRQGDHYEWVNTLYYDQQATNVTSSVSPGDALSLKNYLWGAYADGYYDQLVSDPISNSYLITSYTVGSGTGLAVKGTLMVNHYNYASIFFPAAGTLSSNGTLGNTSYSGSTTTMYYTSSYRGASYGGSNTHWSHGHIGMNCTPIYTSSAPVRCVKE